MVGVDLVGSKQKGYVNLESSFAMFTNFGKIVDSSAHASWKPRQNPKGIGSWFCGSQIVSEWMKKASIFLYVWRILSFIALNFALKVLCNR